MADAQKTPAIHELSNQIHDIKEKISDGEYLNIMNTMGELFKEFKQLQDGGGAAGADVGAAGAAGAGADVGAAGAAGAAGAGAGDVMGLELLLQGIFFENHGVMPHLEMEFEEDGEDEDGEDGVDEEDDEDGEDGGDEEDDEDGEDGGDEEDDEDGEDGGDEEDDEDDDDDDDDDDDYNLQFTEEMKVTIGGTDYYKTTIGNYSNMLISYPDGDELIGRLGEDGVTIENIAEPILTDDDDDDEDGFEDIELDDDMKVTIGGDDYYKISTWGVDNMLFNYPQADKCMGILNDDGVTIEPLGADV